jgi:uncharacterized protein
MLTPDGYRKRLVDTAIDDYLKAFGAVSIRGPKYCGKTWTSRNHAESEIGLQSSVSRGLKDAIRAEPELALRGDAPHLIDEWQDVPAIWDAVRADIDENPGKGKYILCGSSTPPAGGTMHTGVGRIGDIRMRTMSLFESGDSDGSVSLSGLFDRGLTTSAAESTDLMALIRLTVRGGWPDLIGLDTKSAMIRNREYLRKSLEEDVPRLAESSIDVRKLKMYVRSLARNESTVVSDRRIILDMIENGEPSMTPVTLAKYRDFLDRIFLVSDQPAFSCNLRSSVRVGKSPKRHLADPSLAVAAMELTPEKLMADLRTYGFLFEAMCERDLQIYAEAGGGTLFHYRDDNGKEVDAVVEMPDGRWGAFEIKLGADQTDQAASDLLKMAERFEHRPDVLCVISGLAGACYRRLDGVFVVPITSLRE